MFNDIYNKLLSIYGKDDYRIKKENLNDLFLQIFKSDIYKDLSEHFPLYFEAQNVTYSSAVDKLNIVIDRDKQNFKDFQYDEVVSFCKNNNVKFVEPRFFSLYGAGDYGGTLIMSVLDKMLKNESCDLTDCTQKWNFLNIKDAVTGIKILLENN